MAEDGAARTGHTGITWPFTPEGAREAIAELGALGYPAVELFGFVIDAYPGGVEGVRADLDAAGVRLVAAYCSAPLIEPAGRAEDVARMVGWARKVGDLGGDVIVVGASPRWRDAYSREDYRELCRTLDEVGARCAEVGVRACFHPHTGTPVETGEEIDMVMSGVDARTVSMAPDTGQIAKGGADPVAVVRTYRELVRHVHLKDWVGAAAPDTPTDGDRTGWLDYVPLGEGVVDLAGVVDTLREAGYPGWWMVELDGTERAPRPPREAAAASKRCLDRLMGVRA